MWARESADESLVCGTLSLRRPNLTYFLKLVEALISLANLTSDNAQREELYSRATEASNGELDLDSEEDAMDVCL